MRIIYLLTILIFAFSACESQKARRPIATQTGTFIKQSIERNKKLITLQEKRIRKIIDRDSLNEYSSSPYGFWYYFNEETQDTLTPMKGDKVIFEYDITTLNGETIYSRENLGKRKFKMDEEGVFSGLRYGLKLMNEGETATFLFPSDLAFGYYGDNEKIGPNIPIKSKITLFSIRPKNDSIQVQPKTK